MKHKFIFIIGLSVAKLLYIIIFITACNGYIYEDGAYISNSGSHYEVSLLNAPNSNKILDEDYKETEHINENYCLNKENEININNITEESNRNAMIIRDNYIVYDVTKDNRPEYEYEIINESGDIVKRERTWRINPIIEYLDNDSLLSIIISVGANTTQTQYYDVRNDLFSEIYETPILAKHGKVVYMDASSGTHVLVVSDIFDANIYYSEFQLDFHPSANPADTLLRAEFLDDNTLMVVYISLLGDEQEAILVLH